MGFAATLGYVALALLSPWAAYPELASLRIMVWLMGTILVITFVQLLRGRVSLWVPQIPLLGIFLFWTALSVAVTGWLGGAAFAFVQVTIPLTACVALIGNANSSSRLRWLYRVLVLVGLYLSVRVILALEFGVDLDTYSMHEWVETGEDGSQLAGLYRARGLGFLADPNDLAQYLIACLPLAAAPWRRGRMFSNAFRVLLPLGLMGAAIYLTRSRGGLIGVAFLAAVAATRVSRFAAPVAGAGLVAGMLALGFSGGRAASLSEGTGAGRLELWSNALVAAGAHPFFGVGFGRVTEYLEGFTAHNSYLLCLVETGIPGFFFWLAAFTVTWCQAWPMLSRPEISEDARRTSRLGMESLASVLVTSFFLSRTYALTLYIFLGLAVSTFLVARKEQPELLPLFRSRWLAWNGAVAFLLVATFYFLVRLRWMSR